MTGSDAAGEVPGNSANIQQDGQSSIPVEKKLGETKDDKHSKSSIFTMADPTNWDILSLYGSWASIITITTATNAFIQLVNMTAKGHLGSEAMTAGVGVGDSISTYMV